MEEIEVGEYVRTSNNGIKRIDTIFRNKTVNKYGYEIGSEWDGKLYSCIKTTDILKHSKDIIDLIEVGDLIQLKREEKLKYEVLRISYSPSKGKHIHIINPLRMEGGKDIFIEDIKSILTKEQFEQNSYKVEESRWDIKV